MASLNKKLQHWLKEGLLNESQYNAILHYEQTEGKANNHSWWLYSLLILGCSIIGLGIISLIAANWAFIPDTVKLATAFSALGGLAAAIIWRQNATDTLWSDVLISTFIILCLATLGLIGQIYHISIYWYYTLLLWSAITLPIVFFARGLFPYFLWTSLFLPALVWSGVEFSAGDLSHAYQQIPALMMFTPLLAASLYTGTFLLPGLQKFRSSLFFWFQITGLVALTYIDIIRSGGEMREFALAWYLPGYITAALLAVAILLRPDYRPLNKTLLLACMLLFLLFYHPFLVFDGNTRYTVLAESAQAMSFWAADDIRAPLLTILILFCYATHAGNSGHHNTFNAITFLIGLRFVILYFQAMGGLAATGVGLIMSGLMIIGIAWFWYKSRARLQRWSKGLNE